MGLLRHRRLKVATASTCVATLSTHQCSCLPSYQIAQAVTGTSQVRFVQISLCLLS